jgi:Tfp pilus assembly protein PilV
VRPGVSERIHRSDEGLTVVELVVAVLVLAIIVVPLSTSVIVGLTSTLRAEQQTTDTTDQQTLASYFVNDVQSADDISVNTTAPACGGTTAVIQMHWVDPVGSVDKQAAYVADGTGQFERVYCEAGVVVKRATVVNALASAPVVACDPSPCSSAQPGGTPKSVSMQVSTVGSKDGPSYETYSFELQATRRVTA